LVAVFLGCLSRLSFSVVFLGCLSRLSFSVVFLGCLARAIDPAFFWRFEPWLPFWNPSWFWLL
jgi:hypothetical protein